MNNWKIHFRWTIALGGLLLIGIITFWLGGKGNEIVSYVGFASASISIILALVAIFYSMIQHTSSQQNIGEMRTLVSEASRIMTEKASSMERQSVVMSRITQLLAQSIGTGLPQSTATFHLNVSNCSHLGLLALYGLAKSYKHNKPFAVLELLTRRYADTNIRFVLYNYTMGLIIGFSCFLEAGSIAGDLEAGSIKANKLPPAFEEYIVQNVNERIKHASESMKNFLQEGKLDIDSYFAAA